MSSGGVKKITYQRDLVDIETGEKTTVDQVVRIPTEPNYVKVYIDGVLHYADCPAWQSKILHALLRRIDWGNEIAIPSGRKKEIAKDLGIEVGTLDNAISKFVKNNILRKKSTGIFIANPHYFGRGEWKDILKLRLTVDFSSEGIEMKGHVTKTVMDENPNIMDEVISAFEGVKIAEKLKINEHYEPQDNVLASSVLPVNTAKLMAFLRDPANHTEALVMSSVSLMIGFSAACFHQVLTVL